MIIVLAIIAPYFSVDMPVRDVNLQNYSKVQHNLHCIYITICLST
jgi:hypothetical protein